MWDCVYYDNGKCKFNELKSKKCRGRCSYYKSYTESPLYEVLGENEDDSFYRDGFDFDHKAFYPEEYMLDEEYDRDFDNDDEDNYFDPEGIG